MKELIDIKMNINDYKKIFDASIEYQSITYDLEVMQHKYDFKHSLIFDSANIDDFAEVLCSKYVNEEVIYNIYKDNTSPILDRLYCLALIKLLDLNNIPNWYYKIYNIAFNRLNQTSCKEAFLILTNDSIIQYKSEASNREFTDTYKTYAKYTSDKLINLYGESFIDKCMTFSMAYATKTFSLFYNQYTLKQLQRFGRKIKDHYFKEFLSRTYNFSDEERQEYWNSLITLMQFTREGNYYNG